MHDQDSLRRLQDLRYALDQAAIVAITDRRGVITYVNDKFCEISQYGRDELIGQDHRIVNSGHHSKEFMRGLWRTIGHGRVWRGELRNRAKDGSIYWVDTTIVPLPGDDGKPAEYLAIRSDITARKAMEQRLVDQEALTQLGELAAVVAHEVRNPLAGVKGSLQVMRSRIAVTEIDRGVIDTMIARLDTLNNKVDDILKFARPRSPRLEAVDLASVLLDAAASATAAGDAGTGIRLPRTASCVLADREMIRAVFLNLLRNALESGSSAPIEVDVAEMDGACRIDIADRGIGLGGEPEKLFQPFHSTKATGTGLGLAIVRRFLSLQNGSVVLEPRAAGGALARVTLPLAR
jgi:two-component system CheB/CheR fusion protein